jgi:hypothetical protein
VKYTGSIYYLSSFIWVQQGDDKALMEVLDKYGPVAVAINAADPGLNSYRIGHIGYFGECDKNILGNS